MVKVKSHTRNLKKRKNFKIGDRVEISEDTTGEGVDCQGTIVAKDESVFIMRCDDGWSSVNWYIGAYSENMKKVK